MEQTEKKCSKCLETKPFSEFFRAPRMKSGYSTYCKPCYAKVNKENREKNKDRAKQVAQAWQAANREKVAAHSRQWKAKHPDKIKQQQQNRYWGSEENHQKELERGRVYREQNKEKTREDSRQYRQAHPGLSKKYSQAWRDRNPEKSIEFGRKNYSKHRERHLVNSKTWREANPDKRKSYNDKRRTIKYQTDFALTPQEWKWVLELCEHKCLKCGSTKSIEQDHIIPLSRGGGHHIDNVQPLCDSCNNHKHTTSQDYRPDWLKSVIRSYLESNAPHRIHCKSGVETET